MLQLTQTTLNYLYKYSRSLVGKKAQISTFIDALEDLETLLGGLEGLPGHLSTLKGLERPGGPLERCKDGLARLAKLLEPSSGNKLRSFGRDLIWPLKEKQANEILDVLEKQKSAFTCAKR